MMIPILRKYKPVTDGYIRELAWAIKSDGCTGVGEFYHDCCIIHDLAYRFNINQYGEDITRLEADTTFRQCMQEHSVFGRFSPMAWWRYLGVRLFGGKCYSTDVPPFVTYEFLE